MRLKFVFWQWLCLVLAVAAQLDAAAEPTAAAEFHCAGSAQWESNTNFVTLHKIFKLRSSPAVHKLVLTRISGMLANGLNLGTNATPLLEPLLNDFLESETLGSFGGAESNPVNCIVAVKLDAARAQFWHDNFDKALGGGGEKFTASEYDGWRWKKGASNSLWMVPVPARGWLLVGRGDEFSALQADYLQHLKTQGRPRPELQGNWLQADMDWTRLASFAPEWLQLFKPARVKLTIAREQDSLRIDVRLIYPDAVAWQFEPWKLPKNLVLSPLVSFSTGQDVAAFLKMDENFARLDGSPFTNQFCAWAMDPLPFLTYMAWPEADAANTLEKLATEATATLGPELKDFNGVEMTWVPEKKALILSNLRVILPTLQAVKNAADEFLVAGLFPPPHGNKPASDDLWKQIEGRTNLVYYDWELTGPRLQQWRMLGRMFLTRSQVPTGYTARARILEDGWFGQATAYLGNTATEVTRVAPNELSVVRTGPIGLTGIELFLLSDWLSSVGAPSN